MNITVIIVTYNPKKWIEKCFRSLQESNYPVQVIVIDNGSTDDSPDIIKNEYPEVNFISADKNLGFGVANNIGISKALQEGADYVFLLNQDAWIEENTIEKLIYAAQNNPDFDLISPMHLNGLANELDYRFSYFIQPQFCKKLYSDIYFNNIKNQCYEVDFVNAAAWLLSRKCLETVGGFNPSFFLYGEDDNYSKRMKLFNLKLGVYPLARICHDRINRNQSSHFTNFELGFKRDIISRYSDPIQKEKAIQLPKLYHKKILKAIFALNILALKQYRKELNIIKSIPLRFIDKNKEQSLVKGSTFL